MSVDGPARALEPGQSALRPIAVAMVIQARRVEAPTRATPPAKAMMA
jgi:hypothetical protein